MRATKSQRPAPKRLSSVAQLPSSSILLPDSALCPGQPLFRSPLSYSLSLSLSLYISTHRAHFSNHQHGPRYAPGTRPKRTERSILSSPQTPTRGNIQIEADWFQGDATVAHGLANPTMQSRAGVTAT